MIWFGLVWFDLSSIFNYQLSEYVNVIMLLTFSKKKINKNTSVTQCLKTKINHHVIVIVIQRLLSSSLSNQLYLLKSVSLEMLHIEIVASFDVTIRHRF